MQPNRRITSLDVPYANSFLIRSGEILIKLRGQKHWFEFPLFMYFNKHLASRDGLLEIISIIDKT